MDKQHSTYFLTIRLYVRYWIMQTRKLRKGNCKMPFEQGYSSTLFVVSIYGSIHPNGDTSFLPQSTDHWRHILVHE